MRSKKTPRSTVPQSLFARINNVLHFKFFLNGWTMLGVISVFTYVIGNVLFNPIKELFCFKCNEGYAGSVASHFVHSFTTLNSSEFSILILFVGILSLYMGRRKR